MRKTIPRLYCLDQPRSASAELFRTLRTNIRYTRVGGEIRSVLVTSSLPGEGKSTVAVNLAAAMAESGRRVLLLDGDLRTPAVHEAFELTNRTGLTSILVDQAQWQDCVYSIRDSPGLHVLPSGPVSPNPAELLGSDGMKRLFEELHAAWDTIIIDASSVLMPFSDALTLARMAEGVLLVVQSGKVLQKHAAAAKRLLEQNDARLLGAVLNRRRRGTKPYAIRSEEFADWALTSEPRTR